MLGPAAEIAAAFLGLDRDEHHAAIIVREPDATMQLTPQDNQLMSERRILCFKSALRLERRSQDGQNETE
jgi:hypothetical protein